jgi:hypothetical protein
MMNPADHLHTMAATYQDICQGEQPWVALGNFMNDWFDYAKDWRAELVAAPLSLSEVSNKHQLRWAAFCAASVEYLCARYAVLCPAWVYHTVYILPEPWFDAPMAHKPEVRTYLIEQTPEPYTRRNIYCGNRMFANKYELAEQYRHLSPSLRPAS